jgi:hypothetical protein
MAVIRKNDVARMSGDLAVRPDKSGLMHCGSPQIIVPTGCFRHCRCPLT